MKVGSFGYAIRKEIFIVYTIDCILFSHMSGEQTCVRFDVNVVHDENERENACDNGAWCWRRRYGRFD